MSPASVTADLLFEIGCEEIPAGFLARALEALPGLVKERLDAARLSYKDIVALGTPRRIALAVTGVPMAQPDVSEEITGPPAKAAFDAAGKPTKAAIGFAQKNGVPIEALRVLELPGKGAYVAATRQLTGAPTATLLPRLLSELARAIPWKKQMRWASLDEAFVRPVHWMVALFGGEVVPLEQYGVKSGRETRGHRFLAPGALALTGALDDYKTKLRTAFVVVDGAARRTMIEAELARVEKESGARLRPDAALLDEVTNLVEYPQAVRGSFDEAFLEVPAEVIVSAMRSHQRYFAMESRDGKSKGQLANQFVTVAGTVTKDPALVKAGNERVLGARLSDARFFFREDQHTGLEAMAAKLRGVVFQKDLGTVGEKVDRIRKSKFGTQLAGVAEAQWERVVALAKADLTSKMVGEFPDLQGVMGRHYARLAKENAAVADAILEHYLPRGANDALPQGALGAALGVVDRMDTIVGCFGVGLAPTGSNDAFGLRRAALAVLNILLVRGWGVPLTDLIQEAAWHLTDKLQHEDRVKKEVLEFFKTRLRGLLVEQKGLAADCVDAALAAGFDDVPDAAARAAAVAHLRERPDFEPLGIAFKRVGNILKGERPAGEPDSLRFAHASESALWDAFTAARGRVHDFLGKREYDRALGELAALKPAVDKFFDDVMVMDKDPAVKANRLALLGAVNGTFLRIADFRQLAVA